MGNLEQLLALLQVDEHGEFIAGKLSQVLVDKRKRSLLLVKIQEIEDALQSLGQEIRLTPSETEAMRIIRDASKPLTASELAESASGGRLESLKYRQHASASLNSLVEKGVAGKVRGPGRQLYFTEAREAVKQAITQLGQSPDDYDPQAIVEATGLSLARVLSVVQEI